MSDFGFWLVVPAVLALIAGSYWLVSRTFVRIAWKTEPKLPDVEIPSHWTDVISNTVPLFRRLSHTQQEHLLKLTWLFLDKKHIEGAAGFEVTEEVKLTIAAQACFLVLNSGIGLFPTLRTIIVYPDTYVAPRRRRDSLIFSGDDDEYGDDEEIMLGESWSFGTIVLSWRDVIAGQAQRGDGANLLLHEFAHQRDLEGGATDGVPLLPHSALGTWAEVIGRHYEQLRDAALKGESSILDEYGAESQAEFFAVATEAFFERPRELAKHLPELYSELEAFYGLDPAEW